MNKPELEKAYQKALDKIEYLKHIATDIAGDALSDKCDDAIPYIAKLCTEMDLKLTRPGYISLNCELPINLEDDFINEASAGINQEDFVLTYKGEVIEVESIRDIESD
jgi:hypothetical protein